MHKTFGEHVACGLGRCLGGTADFKPEPRAKHQHIHVIALLDKFLERGFGVSARVITCLLFLGQCLYYLESNTRGAVIIGAMGAGGIGLQFLGALQTGSDFENVAYMAILVLITVIAMDMMSARLRRALIGIQKPTR